MPVVHRRNADGVSERPVERRKAFETRGKRDGRHWPLRRLGEQLARVSEPLQGQIARKTHSGRLEQQVQLTNRNAQHPGNDRRRQFGAVKVPRDHIAGAHQPRLPDSAAYGLVVIGNDTANGQYEQCHGRDRIGGIGVIQFRRLIQKCGEIQREQSFETLIAIERLWEKICFAPGQRRADREGNLHDAQMEALIRQRTRGVRQIGMAGRDRPRDNRELGLLGRAEPGRSARLLVDAQTVAGMTADVLVGAGHRIG